MKIEHEPKEVKTVEMLAIAIGMIGVMCAVYYILEYLGSLFS